MILELILKYPRLVASLFAALFAGLIATIICWSIHITLYQDVYIVSATLAAALWAAIMGRRITNVNQSCTYLRAAVLGGVATIFAILYFAIFTNIGIRLQNMFKGLIPFEQTIKHVFIDDLEKSFGGGIFILLFFGWYLIPVGAIAGLFLRWLRTLHGLEGHHEYEGDERAKLHLGSQLNKEEISS